MSDADTQLFQAARPDILIDGAQQAALTEGLTRLEIIETTAGLYRCEARFGNWGRQNGRIDFLYFDRQLLDFGTGFRVERNDRSLFDGRIFGLEGLFVEGGPPEITVLSEDRLQDFRMTRRTRSFSDLSDADVFQRVASEHGLTTDVTLSGPTHRVLAQINQSDLAFLRERARANGVELWVEGTLLKVKARPDRDSTTENLSYGRNLREVTILADVASQRTSARVTGWNVGGKTAIDHEATDSILGGELNDDTSGASILQQAFGDRVELIAHTAPTASAEAQAVAEAYFRAQARRFLVARGVCGPEADLGLGRVIEMEGLGPLFNGRYHVTEIRHRFDGMRGFRTEFTAERPGLGSAN